MIEPLLLLFTGCVGLFATVIMATSYKSNPFFNVFLMLIFLLASSRQLIQGTFELELQTLIRPGASWSAIFLLLVPSFYLYYKNLVDTTYVFRRKDLQHFVFITFFYLAHVIPVIKDSVYFYNEAITDFIIITVFVVFYLFKGFQLLRNKLWNKRNSLQVKDPHYGLIKNWTVYLFTINILLLVALLISIYPASNTNVFSTKQISFFLAPLWLFIYVKILISPEILHGLPKLNKKLLKYKPMLGVSTDWKLSPSVPKGDRDTRLQEFIKSDIVRYTNEVDRLSYTAQIFRDPTCSIADVAKEIGVPVSHITYVFKYHSKISFSEYRMQSRVQDAINLIHNDYLTTNTFETLSIKTGFSTYSPFFTAFKKVTKLSPQEYIKRQKNQHV